MYTLADFWSIPLACYNSLMMFWTFVGLYQYFLYKDMFPSLCNSISLTLLICTCWHRTPCFVSIRTYLSVLVLFFFFLQGHCLHAVNFWLKRKYLGHIAWHVWWLLLQSLLRGKGYSMSIQRIRSSATSWVPKNTRKWCSTNNFKPTNNCGFQNDLFLNALICRPTTCRHHPRILSRMQSTWVNIS